MNMSNHISLRLLVTRTHDFCGAWEDMIILKKLSGRSYAVGEYLEICLLKSAWNLFERDISV